MRLQLLPILLLSLAAAATASEHWFFNSDAEYSTENAKGCCLPKQWEGKVGTFYMWKRIVRPSIKMADSKVGIDYKNQKAGAKSMIFCPYRKKAYKVKSVIDFKAKKAYTIYGGKCKAYDVTAALPDNCIPGKFSKLMPYYYGAGSSQLNLSPYGYRDNKLEYFLAVASGNCAPIKGAFRTRYRSRTKSIGKYQYYNITIGNKDADLYSVPANCTTAIYEETRRFGRFFHRMLTFNEHPMPEDSDLSSVSDEPLSPVHKMLVSHAHVLMNDASRNCRWCGRFRDTARRSWGSAMRGWRHFGNGWNRFRDGM